MTKQEIWKRCDKVLQELADEDLTVHQHSLIRQGLSWLEKLNPKPKKELKYIRTYEVNFDD